MKIEFDTIIDEIYFLPTVHLTYYLFDEKRVENYLNFSFLTKRIVLKFLTKRRKNKSYLPF